MTYNEIIKQRLNQLNLTAYGAAQMIAAEHDLEEPLTTTDQRVRQFIERDPKSLTQFTQIVEGLGGKIRIDWE